MSESLIVQSNEEGLREVEEFLDHVFDTYHVAHYAGTITVPVLQAVQNAIHLGNADDASKQVHLEVGHCQGGLFFEVSDEGKRFDYTSLLSSDLSTEQGRGLFLITTLSDRYTYSQGGRTLRMEFDIAGIIADDAVKRSARMQHFFQREVVEA